MGARMWVSAPLALAGSLATIALILAALGLMLDIVKPADTLKRVTSSRAKRRPSSRSRPINKLVPST